MTATRLSRLICSVMLSCCALMAFAPSVSAAISVREQFESALYKAGLTSTRTAARSDNALTSALGSAVTVFLGLVGVATFVLVVYAGALWILAAGNEDKVTQAKNILKGAAIGLILVFSAYVIVNFALTSLQQALSKNAPTAPSGQ